MSIESTAATLFASPSHTTVDIWTAEGLQPVIFTSVCFTMTVKRGQIEPAILVFVNSGFIENSCDRHTAERAIYETARIVHDIPDKREAVLHMVWNGALDTVEQVRRDQRQAEADEAQWVEDFLRSLTH